MDSKQITALVLILLYMAATVVIGLVATKRKMKAIKDQSNEDFLMAGKSLGPVVLAGTLFAANTGGASTTGIATNVYDYGLGASWYVIAAGIGFVLVSFIAPYFRRSSANSVPHIIALRYGKPSHIFTAITSISALFLATGAQIIATGSIIESVTGLPFNIAAIITAVVVITYTMVGGFTSVTATNLMHVLFITVGMGIAMLTMVFNPQIGGFENLFAKAGEVTINGQNYLTSMTHIPFLTIIGYIAMYFMTFPTGQEIVQTYASAKNGASAKLGSILAGLVSAAFAIIPAIIGLIAYTFLPALDSGKAKNAMAAATMEFAPAVIAGVVLSAIVAATISSASGNMIGCATMFVNDLYVPYIKNNHRDDKKEVFVTRVVMTVVGLIGLIISITASDIISVMMSAFALRSAGPFAAFICGLFYKNVTKRAGFIAIVVGTVMAGIWKFALHQPGGLSEIVPGALVAFVVIFVISKIERAKGVPACPPIEFNAE